MTPEDWKEVDRCLQLFICTVKLKCDEYMVALMLCRITQLRNVIQIFVNDEVRGTWLLDDCEERRRFMCPVKKPVYSQKQKANLKKLSRKARREAGLPALDATVTVYRPYWTSFKALKRHLIRNNNSIELVREKVDGDA